MPSLSPDATDDAELAEMLQFLSDWLRSDPRCLGARPARPAAQPVLPIVPGHGRAARPGTIN
jgi:hypothetical protein